MKHWMFAGALASAAAIGFPAQAQSTPGADVESLLAMARERNPEFTSARREADAASVKESGPKWGLTKRVKSARKSRALLTSSEVNNEDDHRGTFG